MNSSDLLFVCSVNNWPTFHECLAKSECIGAGRNPLVVHVNCTSAAQAFNAVMDSAPAQRWVVWVHQDVHLPPGWADLFVQRLEEAERRWPHVALAGLYGVQKSPDLPAPAPAQPQFQRAGYVIDRGHPLKEHAALPCLVDSLDELLVAVRADSGLRMDPALGFDFYATDLVLQAQAQGKVAVAVDACCEHWSDTPMQGPEVAAVAARILRSAERFEHKWQQLLPIFTPCFEIHRLGDSARAMAQILARPSNTPSTP